MENPNFLRQKYVNLNKSLEVESAAKRTKARTGREFPKKSAEDDNIRIQNYLDRLKQIFENPDKDKRERGIEFVKRKFHEEFVIKPEEIPEAYFESIKRRHREEGHGDIEIHEDYRRELSETVIADQVRSLDNWIDYLSSNEAKYPDWLKYFSMRGILRMGRYDKKKKSFTERTGGTTAPFPDLNREALAIVLDSFERQERGEQPKFGYDIQEDTKRQFLEFLEKKNFAKLYALAVEEFKPIVEELLKVTEGEWRTYPRGSDPKVLVESIAPYGTGWCLRGESMAERYLIRDKNELQVFYSLDKEGNPTIPRVVTVVNAANQLAEVRGVAPEENLDPYIGPVVEEKLKEFPDGEAYKRKSNDMKQLTKIENKTKSDQKLNKDDLVFLYEINSTIEGFGYQRDPRIEEIRQSRDPKQDAPIVFECQPEEIAWKPEDMNENTKAYVGKWNIDVFQKVRQYPSIQYLYESFPDKKIFMQTLETDPDVHSPEQAEKALHISILSKDILYKTQLSKEKQKYELVRFTVGQLGFPNGATAQEIYEKAVKIGLELCPAEVGPHLRLQYPGKERMLIAMEQITDRDGDPDVFRLVWWGDQLLLDCSIAGPKERWYPDDEFVFRFRKLEAEKL